MKETLQTHDSPTAREMAEALIGGDTDIMTDPILPAEKSAMQNSGFDELQRTILKYENNLKIHNKRLKEDRIYLGNQLDGVIRDLKDLIAAQEKEGSLTRKEHQVWQIKIYVDNNPLIALLETLRDFILDETKTVDRQHMLQRFKTVIKIFPQNEQSYYHQAPSLYKNLEKAYYSALELDHLPRDWDSEENRDDIKKALSRNFRYNQQKDFYESRKHKKNDFREDIFDKIDSYILNATSRSALIISIKDLIDEVRKKDTVLADYLFDVVEHWRKNSFLADSLEDTLGGTRKHVIAIKEAYENHASILADNFQDVQTEIEQRMTAAKAQITASKEVFNGKHGLNITEIKEWIESFEALHDPITVVSQIEKYRDIAHKKDATELKKQVGTKFAEILKKKATLNTTDLSGKEKEVMNHIYDVMVETYQSFVNRDFFPSDFKYQQHTLRLQVTKAFVKYNGKSWIRVSPEKRKSYEDLIKNIDQAKNTHDLYHTLIFAELSTQAHHELNSFFGTWKYSPRKTSRWAKAIKRVRLNNKWLPNHNIPIDDSVVFVVKNCIRKYFKSDWFFHNKERQQQANNVVIELYKIARKNVEQLQSLDQTDDDLEQKRGDIRTKMRLEQKSKLTEWIGTIRRKHESSSVLKTFMPSRECRLVKNLIFAQRVLESTSTLPVDYIKEQLPILQLHVNDAISQFKKTYSRLQKEDPILVLMESFRSALPTHTNIKQAQHAFDTFLKKLETKHAEASNPPCDITCMDIIKSLSGYLRNAQKSLEKAQIFKPDPGKPPNNSRTTPVY